MTEGPEPAGDSGASDPGLAVGVVRVGWIALGLVSVGVGGIGIVVPGLPTTVFFIIAAWAFSKSSPRLEAWVLGLPRIGPMVSDYRAGLGMPRRAKVVAIAMIVIFAGIAAWVSGPVLRAVIIVAGAIGIGVVARWVPTRETVLADPSG